MGDQLKIKSALISVFDKSGLDQIAQMLHRHSIVIYSTGGTKKYIENLGIPVTSVEDLTQFPSILGGRVKTLHPKIFGGILAKREKSHLDQIRSYEIPEIDLVVVDLYPFEETLLQTNDEAEIIEKIDIGGISLIRAAAKNYQGVLVIPSKKEYPVLTKILREGGVTSTAQRKQMAWKAFSVSSHYDAKIFQYFNRDQGSNDSLRVSYNDSTTLRYGENPHQSAVFYGNLERQFDQIQGKALSYNNLVDIDAAHELITDFHPALPAFAVLKHTNPCGLAIRDTVLDAWKSALAGDPVSAFGGILISNTEIDEATAGEIDKIFYEVLIAPSFHPEALDMLKRRKKRILLRSLHKERPSKRIKTLLIGMIAQEADHYVHDRSNFNVVTEAKPSTVILEEMEFANTCVKHLKSNAIVITKGKQILGMGCGQTSRVAACQQAILKAGNMGFSLKGACLASDAFFPFPDCVELAHQAGISHIIQPGGSIKDQLSIDSCNGFGLSMVFTGIRHFKH